MGKVLELNVYNYEGSCLLCWSEPEHNWQFFSPEGLVHVRHGWTDWQTATHTQIS